MSRSGLILVSNSKCSKIITKIKDLHSSFLPEAGGSYSLLEQNKCAYSNMNINCQFKLKIRHAHTCFIFIYCICCTKLGKHQTRIIQLRCVRPATNDFTFFQPNLFVVVWSNLARYGQVDYSTCTACISSLFKHISFMVKSVILGKQFFLRETSHSKLSIFFNQAVVMLCCNIAVFCSVICMYYGFRTTGLCKSTRLGTKQINYLELLYLRNQ